MAKTAIIENDPGLTCTCGMSVMGIVGQRIKKNRQSWVDKNLEIMVNTI
jgi:hypothetical protein